MATTAATATTVRPLLSPAQRRRREYLGALLFVLPALINFAVFRYFPIVSAFWVSLWDYSLLGGFGDFLGLQQYTRALEDPIFWKSMRVTVLFVLLKVPFQVMLALGLALVTQREVRGMGVVRSAIFTPVVSSIIVVSIVWAMMYHAQQGLINSMLATIGLPRQRFLSDPALALPAMTLMTIWKDVGFSMIIVLAGLKGISSEYYEAAAIDGADRLQQFWYITLPLLKRVMLFVVVTQTIQAFQVFAPAYAMTRGGPQDATKVIVYYIYQHAFAFQEMGYASALSIIVLFIILAVSLGQMRVLRSNVEH
ncbi:MAG: carbohydrate ABC transporter permease [Armatimonadota bacterium]